MTAHDRMGVYQTNLVDFAGNTYYSVGHSGILCTALVSRGAVPPSNHAISSWKLVHTQDSFNWRGSSVHTPRIKYGGLYLP